VKRSPPPAEPAPATVAVVIPTLNEAGGIGRLLDHVAAQGFDEIIVADGGSTDGTPALAAAREAVTLVNAGCGRGVQMDAGARACRSDALLFLHADTLLPQGAAGLILNALADPRVAGGAFSARFDRPGLLLGLYSLAGRFESPLTTFGDQAYFTRRAVYARSGGFPAWPFLEDVELRRRLKRMGRFVKLREPVTTSARRFVEEGILRRQTLNLAVLVLFYLGVSPHRLARCYRAHRAARAGNRR
jgi:rSAM/selenodomain-associated transferase 2